MAFLVRTNQRTSVRDGKGGDRFLITVTVLGSPGPIRFVAKEGDRVSDVIATVLRAYARERRRPVLGANSNDFLLYCSSFASEVLENWESISSNRGRNFVLFKKEHLVSSMVKTTEEAAASAATGATAVDGNKGGRAIWKTWFNSLKVTSH